MIELKLLKLTENAKMPTKAHESRFEDAAFDIFCNSSFQIAPGERLTVSTGISFIIPDGFWLKLHERSGLASKKGIQILGGVIDSAYTGEIKVIMFNSGTEALDIFEGAAIAQFTIEKVTKTHIAIVPKEDFEKEAKKRIRGEKGFGSSGR